MHDTYITVLRYVVHSSDLPIYHSLSVKMFVIEVSQNYLICSCRGEGGGDFGLLGLNTLSKMQKS